AHPVVRDQIAVKHMNDQLADAPRARARLRAQLILGQPLDGAAQGRAAALETVDERSFHGLSVREARHALKSAQFPAAAPAAATAPAASAMITQRTSPMTVSATLTIPRILPASVMPRPSGSISPASISRLSELPSTHATTPSRKQLITSLTMPRTSTRTPR